MRLWLNIAFKLWNLNFDILKNNTISKTELHANEWIHVIYEKRHHFSACKNFFWLEKFKIMILKIGYVNINFSKAKCCNYKTLIQIKNFQNLLQFLYLWQTFYKLGYSSISSCQDMVHSISLDLNHFPNFSGKHMRRSHILVKMQAYILQFWRPPANRKF